MWTTENRPRYNRDRLHWPSDLTDEEWALVEPLIPPAKRGGCRRRVVVREVVNGAMDVLSTGCQWRYLPQDLPPKSTAHDYLTRWNLRRHARSHPSRTVCAVSGGSGQSCQPDRLCHRQSEREERGKRSYAGGRRPDLVG